MELKHIWYLIRRMDTRIADNMMLILQTTGTAKATHLIDRVKLLRLKQRTMKSIKVYTDKHILKAWITTDNLGSGYDTRYTHIDGMDSIR